MIEGMFTSFPTTGGWLMVILFAIGVGLGNYLLYLLYKRARPFTNRVLLIAGLTLGSLVLDLISIFAIGLIASPG